MERAAFVFYPRGVSGSREMLTYKYIVVNVFFGGIRMTWAKEMPQGPSEKRWAPWATAEADRDPSPGCRYEGPGSEDPGYTTLPTRPLR